MPLTFISYHIIYMKQNLNQGELRRTKRNFSQLQPQQTHFKLLSIPYHEEVPFRPKKNSIKINKSKLPPDFFPRTESLRKKGFSLRPSIQQQKNPIKFMVPPKAESQCRAVSPEKTSFFGFFDEGQKSENTSKNKGSKRQFESRDDPKRQKVYFEKRNLTPMVGYQRNGILEIGSPSYDESIFEFLKKPKKFSKMEKSPAKGEISEQNSYKKEVQDPEKLENQYKQSIELQLAIEDSSSINNFTFFNAKSLSFPPIFKHSRQI